MYSTTHNHVVFFTDPHGKSTEKMLSGKVSEAFKTGKQDENGKDIFAYETHRARFVGKAREKAANLTDKTRITLTEWSARNQTYTIKVEGKDQKRYFSCLMVMDFELREQNSTEHEADPVPESAAPVSDFAMLEDDDAQLPF